MKNTPMPKAGTKFMKVEISEFLCARLEKFAAQKNIKTSEVCLFFARQNHKPQTKHEKHTK